MCGTIIIYKILAILFYIILTLHPNPAIVTLKRLISDKYL